MADPELQRQEELLQQAESFRYNAHTMINDMELMSTRNTSWLVDEVLHSIFFLGKINKPPFTPKQILSDDVEVISHFKNKYPRPFDLYSSKEPRSIPVPRRGPFSCFLDMVVHLTGQDNKEEIIQELQQFIGTLKGSVNEKPLVSRTICVSQSRSPGSVRYYGVSMSANAARRKKVLIGASCLRKWDSYVADAVMTFYPERGTEGFARKTYFDGTIQVPEQHVRCETFDLYNGEVKPPCKSCHELFGLTGHTGRVNPYGNCAEAESLSNLFQGDKAVRRKVLPPPGGDRARAERTVNDTVRSLVRSFKAFNKWTGGEGGFYTPQ
ncbi:hypothetical protein PFLUV_G00093560 [Perca fluviatilis]|uniref:Uncharacterized protein n=1 Tax=Perca fluviatilis TaxID=8168 RepID=A0A6A5FA59_PERFL|nr:uncharacterized protein LOC120563446 [Perca fluviatilis]KAF1386323.1 hypothetical protein PFLUV_G00093560 [Perca fluviatilis]